MKLVNDVQSVTLYFTLPVIIIILAPHDDKMKERYNDQHVHVM